MASRLKPKHVRAYNIDVLIFDFSLYIYFFINILYQNTVTKRFALHSRPKQRQFIEMHKYLIIFSQNRTNRTVRLEVKLMKGGFCTFVNNLGYILLENWMLYYLNSYRFSLQRQRRFVFEKNRPIASLYSQTPL